MSAAKVIRDAVILTVFWAFVGILFNSLRPSGLPLVAQQAYEIFVPCPEPLGEVHSLEPEDALIRDEKSLLIDARHQEAYTAWHLPGSRNVPFDYLEGVPDEVVRQIARSGAARVIVYGDGQDPDSGRELARELAGRGVRNVFYVQGGADALSRLFGGGVGGK